MGIWKFLIILFVIIFLIIIGNKVIYINDYAIVTTTIQLPAAGESAINKSSDINYPTGFTSSNCVVVSIMSHNTLHTDWWVTPQSPDSSSIMLGNGNVKVALKPSNLTVWAEKSDVAEQGKEVTVKIVLMKI